MKLLIVDDNELNREMAEDILEDIGVDSISAESGSEALKILAEQKVDAVLMDYMMPEMNGAEATKKLHEIKQCENLPVIAMTAEEDPATLKILLESGMGAVLHKPVDPLALYKTLLEYTNDALKAPQVAGSSEIESDEILKAMRGIGFDVTLGLKHTGSVKVYKQYALDFSKLLPEMLNTIDSCLEKKDYENFTVTIHGLKSNFRALGDMDLFKKCQECESLGKAGAYSDIAEKYPRVKEEISTCLDGLKNIFNAEKTLPPLPSRELVLALKELRDAMQTFDLDTADVIMEDLEKHEASSNLASKLGKLYREVAGLKYEAAVVTIDEIVEMIEGGQYD